MKISSKISTLGVVSVAIAAAALIVIVFIQKGALRSQLNEILRKQGIDEATKIAQSAYSMCASSEGRTQRRLDYNLGVARESLSRLGPISFGPETASWDAVNQFTKQKQSVALPKVIVGNTWLGQNRATNTPSPLVDEVKRYTRDYATIFQRMNDEGDMLRVCTSVVGTDGNRAIGTFIPRRNEDGTENPVVATVLRGETYRGRAFVVNEWHAAAYEPIWDSQKKKVVGMLYVGVSLTDISKDAHQNVLSLKVGKTGYVYVLGTKGDQRGKYLVSKNGERDGESIWDAKDASGRLFIQAIVEKGLKCKDGSIEVEYYPWKNKDETVARMKFAAITYFEPWDWVIGASTYEDDQAEARIVTATALNRLMWWVAGTAAIAIIVSLLLSYLVSRGIALPLNRLIGNLSSAAHELGSASSQVAQSSQSLAEGASEQAASLEETGASLEEMSSMTRQNAENAQTAKDLAKSARTAAESGAQDMQAMGAAMDAIKVSSSNIAKIIKTIDEIAFQTNILALNAAVEAARAGQAGAGFAVVADEVRNLAQRSAQAARETAEKIDDSVRKSEHGVEISAKVAKSLSEILGQVRRVDELVAQIATASREQAQGLQQVNTAVSQMDHVTQGNAASAEESASAAEELSSQAATLKQVVAELQQLVGGTAVATEQDTLTDMPSRHREAPTAQRSPTESRMHVQTMPLSTPIVPDSPVDSGELVKWDDARLSTGVEEIDQQHRKLIDAINRLHKACQQGKARDELKPLIDFLGEYAQQHFRHEEGLMEHHQCPARGANKLAHAKFLSQFAELRAEFDRSGGTTSLALKLKDMVAQWLVSHICSVDTQLRSCRMTGTGDGCKHGNIPMPEQNAA